MVVITFLVRARLPTARVPHMDGALIPAPFSAPPFSNKLGRVAAEKNSMRSGAQPPMSGVVAKQFRRVREAIQRTGAAELREADARHSWRPGLCESPNRSIIYSVLLRYAVRFKKIRVVALYP
jgi:hypothetical protein